MTRILITEPITANGLKILQEVGETIQIQSTDVREILKELPLADILLVKYFQANKEIMNTAPQLKIIAKHGVGVNTIDIDYATELGILVLNAPTGNTTSVIEFTWGLIISLVRNIQLARLTEYDAHPQTKRLWGMELAGKTLGVIGLGTIGSGIARIAHAFNMPTLAYDPYIDVLPVGLSSTALVSLDDLLSKSYIIAIAAPLTSQTYHLISEHELASMEPGSYIVNTSRGGIVDENSLYNALQKGHLAGAALDVVENEPISKDHPLLNLPNVIVTPHLASGTHDAQWKVAQEICTDIARVIKGGKPLHPVNSIAKAYRLYYP